MKQIIRATLNKSAGTITFPEFTTIDQERLMHVRDVTAKVTLYQVGSEVGTVAGNVLTLGYDVSNLSNSDKIQALYEPQAASVDESGALSTSPSALNAIDDEVTARPRPGSSVVLTASGQILSGPGQLLGFYVASTTSGTVLINNGLTAVNPVSGTITPAVGYHNFPADLAVGGYITITGTINVSFFVIAD